MIVMMIVMLLPLVALPVFWLVPLGEAIPIYVVCFLIWAGMMWVMRASMKKAVTTGAEAMIGKQTTVVSQVPSDVVTPYRVQLQGEIWRASSRGALHPGDTAVVVSVEGNKLAVRKE